MSGKLFTAKVLIVGNSNTGKTSLATRYVQNIYNEDYMATLGVDFYLKNIELDSGNILKLQIWDTAGQERFKSIVQQYYRGADGAVLTFCRADKASFEAIPLLVDLCRSHNKDLPIIVVETKIDSVGLTQGSDQHISDTDIMKLCTNQKTAFVKSSAKTGENVEIVFRILADQMLTKIENARRQSKGDLSNLHLHYDDTRLPSDSYFCCK